MNQLPFHKLLEQSQGADLNASHARNYLRFEIELSSKETIRIVIIHGGRLRVENVAGVFEFDSDSAINFAEFLASRYFVPDQLRAIAAQMESVA
jgi:hypothetical protein